MSTARRVLVVNDDPALCAGYQSVLTAKGHAVVAATSGEDALWELRRESFDAVVTGLTLRGISGLDLAEEARVVQPGLPVVIVAGEGAAAGLDQAAGESIVMRAPVSPEQLAETVDRLLQSARPVPASQTSPAVAAAAARILPSPLARLKGVLLFFLAPFVGLVYIAIFPIVGLGMLAGMVKPESAKTATGPQTEAAPGERGNILATAASMLAVGIVGLACAVVAPILGIGLLLWFGIEAWGKLGAKAMGT